MQFGRTRSSRASFGYFRHEKLKFSAYNNKKVFFWLLGKKINFPTHVINRLALIDFYIIKTHYLCENYLILFRETFFRSKLFRETKKVENYCSKSNKPLLCIISFFMFFKRKLFIGTKTFALNVR